MVKVLLLLLGSAKFGKILLVVGTMALSIAAYSLVFGWPYAVGLVLLIFIHEMGHYMAAQQRGLKVGLPTFIPFVGAWIQLKEQPMNAEVEAYVGMAGPLVGSIGALGCYILARELDNRLLLALSYSGFFINLFNLVPVSPFDGGRITAVLSPRIWLVGAPMLLAFFLWRPSPLLILMAIMSAPSVMAAFRYRADAPEHKRYYETSLETKVTYASLYLGLAAFLAIMSFDVKNMLGPS